MDNEEMEYEEKQFLTMLNEAGEEVEYEVVLVYDSKETGKSYVVYTDGSLDSAGNLSLMASVLKEVGDEVELSPVETEEEWILISDEIARVRDAEYEDEE